MRGSFSFRALAVVGLLVPAAPVVAAPLLRATGFYDEYFSAPSIATQHYIFQQYDQTQVGNIGTGINVSYYSPTFAEAGLTFSSYDSRGLHASASTSYDKAAGNPAGDAAGYRIIRADGAVTATFSDFTLGVPAGGGATTATYLNLRLGGDLTASASNITSSFQSEIAVTVRLTGNGLTFYQTANANMFTQPQGVLFVVDPALNGLSSGVSSTNARFGPFNLPASAGPMTLSIELEAFTTCGADEIIGGAAVARSDFSHTLSFATDRPVFDLPAGYTINSPDARVVNNTWSAPVPEPTTAVPYLIAAALLGRRRRA